MIESMRLRRFLRRSLAHRSGPRSRPLRGRHWPMRLATLACATLGLVGAILAVWWLNTGRLFETAAPTTALASVAVTLKPNDTVLLGRADLGQRGGWDSADIAHLQIRRNGDVVEVVNVSTSRRLYLRYADRTGGFAGRWRLAAGDKIVAGGNTIAVVDVDANTVTLDLGNGDRTRRLVLAARGWTAATIDGTSIGECRRSGLLSRAATAGSEALGLIREQRVADLGGRLNCSVDEVLNIGLDGVPFRALAIVARSGDFDLEPGDSRAHAETAIELRRGTTRLTSFSAIGSPLDHPIHGRLESLVLGRTTYAVSATDTPEGLAITLSPIDKVHRLAAPQNACPTGDAACLCRLGDDLADLGPANPRVTRCFSAPAADLLSHAAVPSVLALLTKAEWLLRMLVVLAPAMLRLALLLVVLRGLGRKDGPPASIGAVVRRSWQVAAVSLAAALALVPEIALNVGMPLTLADVTRSIILAFGVASVAVVADPRLGVGAGLAWTAVTLLSALGSLTLTSLALDAPSSHWTLHLAKHSLLFLGPLAVIATFVATLSRGEIARLLDRLVFGSGVGAVIARGIPLIGIVGLFVAWAFFGREEGLGGFQPVEFGKIAVVVILGSVAVGLERATDPANRRSYRRWLWVTIAVVMPMMGALVVVPAVKSDYSPLLIIMITALALIALFFLPWLLRWVKRAFWRVFAGFDAPMRVPRRAPGLPSGAIIALIIAGVLGACSAVVVTFPNLSSRLLIDEGAWPQDRDTLLGRLEAAAFGWRRVPAERTLSYVDFDLTISPDGTPPTVRYRDLGLQLLRSREALAAAPCDAGRLVLPAPVTAILAAAAGGTDCNAAPLAEVGEPNDGTVSVDDLVRIPVIQNDFIGTYLTARFGLGITMAAVMAQAALLLSAIGLGLTLSRPDGRGEPDRMARRFLRILVAGGGLLLALHWAIAWSNILGLLPVMGQPMSWIAAATSHHLFMVIPVVVILLIAARVAGERPYSFPVGPPRRR